MSSGVKAQCKNCGGEAPADEFKLHYQIRTMVCPKCFRDPDHHKPKVKLPDKPADWDNVDEYLKKASKIREDDTASVFKKIPGTHQVICSCQNCKYEFKYDPFRKMPRTCPYCNNQIPRLKTFGLL